MLFGAVDYWKGREVAISAFYMIPICWACWTAGREAGLVLAVFSAAVWFVGDSLAGYPYAHPAIPYWNGFMLLLLFVVIVLLLSAFKTAHYRLEETVQKRTSALQVEIAQRQRAEAARLQAERLAAVGAMAAEVAHEVRNPLGSIALNLDLIQKEVHGLAQSSRHPAEEGESLIREMRVEVQRIQHVIDDYLQFARLPKPQRQPLDLNTWLAEKLAFLNTSLERACIKLRTMFDPCLKSVNADPEQLWQAILNLIRNAIEAMPQGGELTVDTREDSQHAAVSIRDQGKGMTSEQLGRMFVPFFSTKPSGTGLGLTLVQQIITEHGGHVQCESRSGRGSTFTIYLPFLEHTP
jgi:signal transduction histidine kinase